MERSHLMSIVNINDDSFSNDGSLDPVEALLQARDHILAGADIIDIGAESARTNRGPITVEEECRRLESFLSGWPDLIAALGIAAPALSANTWRAGVLERVLPSGLISIVNDISGLPDARNAELAAHHGARLIIMHSIGEPKVPHTHQLYDDVWATMLGFFREKVALARSAGLPDESIILDPGIDFAKQRDDNLAIYAHIERLHELGYPVLLPISRKTVIGDVLDLPDATARDAGTIACLTTAEARGRHIYRVHHTRAAKQSLTMLEALRAPAS